MKRFLYILCAAVLLVSGCGAPKPAVTKVRPFWADEDRAQIEAIYPSLDYIFAVGTADGEENDANVKITADNNALNEITRKMKVVVSNVIRNVDRTVEKYSNAEHTATMESEFLSHTLTFSEGELRGVKFERWYDKKNKRHHALAVLSKREDYGAIIQKGISAQAAGDRRTAVECFTIAKALKPFESEAYFYLATALESYGKLKDAVAMYEDIITTVQDPGWKQQAKDRLRLVRNRGAEDLIKQAEKADFKQSVSLLKEALFYSSDFRIKEKVSSAYQDMIIKAAASSMVQGAKKNGILKMGVFEILDEFGKKSPAGNAIADKISAELVLIGDVKIIERSRIEDVISEAEVSGGLALEEIGRRFGIDGMIVGTIGRRINIRLLNKEDASIIAALSEEWFGSEKGLQRVFLEDGKETKEKVEQEIDFEITIFGERRVGYNWIQVDMRDGSVMSSGDVFKINFLANRDAYVYVLYYDSMGGAYMLFPSSETYYASRIKANSTIVLPGGEDEWYELDENTGKETFYFIASIEPLADIEKLLAEMEKTGGGKKIAQAIANRGTRGISKVRYGKKVSTKSKSGKSIEKVSELVNGLGSAVRVITIYHR